MVSIPDSLILPLIPHDTGYIGDLFEFNYEAIFTEQDF
jgi:hypothetical protein